jgi:polysaccharide pyruvyl transferase WcaK-like protein
MDISLTRIKNAANFYINDFKRERSKEHAIIQGLKSNKPLLSYMGWIGHNNLGDEILYDAHKVLFPDFAVVPFRDSKRANETIAKRPGKLRAGILGGGTLINQSSLWLDQMATITARDLPLFCLGTGVMPTDFRPIGGDTNFDRWVEVLNSFSFIGVRGPDSLKALKAAGVAKAQITGDTALALAPTTYKPRPGKKVIGFNYGIVKENQLWGDADTYTDNVVKALQTLIADGYEIHLLPVWDKDIASNKALLVRVNSQKCTMIECFDSLENYSAELEKCDVFIGQKLHATVMACMRRIPSLMIEYQPKCHDFMASIDMDAFILKTSDCTPETLIDMLRKLQKDSKKIEQKLDKRIMQHRTKQFELAAKISKQLQ